MSVIHYIQTNQHGENMLKGIPTKLYYSEIRKKKKKNTKTKIGKRKDLGLLV